MFVGWLLPSCGCGLLPSWDGADIAHLCLGGLVGKWTLELSHTTDAVVCSHATAQVTSDLTPYTKTAG